MEICRNHGDGEVIYECNQCPVCLLEEENKRLKKERNTFEDRSDNLEFNNDYLKDCLLDMQNEMDQIKDKLASVKREFDDHISQQKQ